MAQNKSKRCKQTYLVSICIHSENRIKNADSEHTEAIVPGYEIRSYFECAPELHFCNKQIAQTLELNPLRAESTFPKPPLEAEIFFVANGFVYPVVGFILSQTWTHSDVSAHSPPPENEPFGPKSSNGDTKGEI